MKKILFALLFIGFCSIAYSAPDRSYIVDANERIATIDASTHALNGIDYEHHEIHAGSHFFYTDKATLAANASTSYVISTPNTTKWTHMTFAATGSAITTVDLYESIDLTGVGARQTIVNSNRNSATTSGMEIWDAIAPGTVGGTLIWSMSSGSATAQSRAGLSAERSNEIILKKNTRYLLRITSGTNDNLTNLQLEWYEHTDKG
jgi:hypothetical protein